jgi:exonuclease SbcD
VKLAHIADPHLGIRQYHRQTPSGINQREADIAQAFRAAIDGVIAARPDAVMVAGDLFHSVRPTNQAIVFAFRQFQRLREALPKAPIVLIAGNHDTPRSTETGSILRLFEELAVDVAVDQARRLVYPDLDLSILAVPHQALAAGERPSLSPEGAERNRVLLLHGEVEGVFPSDRSAAEYGGALIDLRELGDSTAWSYVALGHYHVQHEVAPRVWYAGSLDYVSSNLWGELADEREHGSHGKGWLLVDLERGEVERHPVALVREILDLPPLDEEGLPAAAVDACIAERLRGVPGGIADKIIRLVVYNLPRHVGRELNHSVLRGFKSAAMHLHLDFRRPEVNRSVGMGAPGRRQTLPELVRSYLMRRLIPAELDRDAFVHLGEELIDAVERDLSGA